MGMDTTMTTTNMLVGSKDCGGGVTHVVFEFAPTCVETVPDSHAIQSDSLLPPVVGRYLPAPQFWQTATSLAPALVEYLPATHAMHEVAPDCREYLPGTQAVQTPSSKVDPVNVVASTAEALLKPTPIGQVALVMLRHVDSFRY